MWLCKELSEKVSSKKNMYKEQKQIPSIKEKEQLTLAADTCSNTKEQNVEGCQKQEDSQKIGSLLQEDGKVVPIESCSISTLHQTSALQNYLATDHPAPCTTMHLFA